MAELDYFQFPYGSDNYSVLIHSADTGETACVDPGDGDAVLKALGDKGWNLTEIWITHHHGDHVAGLEQVKQATGCKARGPVEKSGPIPGLDEHLSDGDSFSFAGKTVSVIHTPGHTTDMINYYLPDEGIAFTGDTLFVMGCGRVFEGTPEMMWDSLSKLAKLPKDTVIYCAHEYTAANARFAVTVDPDNAALAERLKTVELARRNNLPTIPTTMIDELATNPFLRAGDPSIRSHLGMEDASDAEVFAEIRKRKDNA